MTSRVIGVLSWYQEAPSWLGATVASFGRVIDHLIAVDGPYAAFPHNGRVRSDPEQVEVIQRTCDALGIGLTLHQPREPFFGNEVEKRSLCFDLAMTVATPGVDWCWVFDGDEVLTRYPHDLRTRLDCIERDAVEVVLTSRQGYEGAGGDIEQVVPLPTDSSHDLRMLFRALPGLRVSGRHDLYVAGTGDDTTILWGPTTLPVVPAARIGEVEVEHRSDRRALHRRNSSLEYYRTRDALGLESTGVRLMETPDGRMEVVA
jgi:hypothetical protein